MRTFRDSAGRTWTIALTIGAARNVRSLLGVDLLQPEAGDPPLLTRLGTDIILLCDVIFALVQPQAVAAGVSDEQFAAALGGDVILAAQQAFYEELIDFFRSAGRGDRARAIEAQQALITAAVEAAAARIDAVDVRALVQETMTPGRPSGVSPAVSVSTLAP